MKGLVIVCIALLGTTLVATGPTPEDGNVQDGVNIKRSTTTQKPTPTVRLSDALDEVIHKDAAGHQVQDAPVCSPQFVAIEGMHSYTIDLFTCIHPSLFRVACREVSWSSARVIPHNILHLACVSLK